MNAFCTIGFRSIAAFAAILSTSALAQQSKKPERDLTLTTLSTADRSSQPDIAGPVIELTALSGDGRATFLLQGGSDQLEEEVTLGQIKRRRSNWQLALSAPLNEDGDFTDIATLDALASGFKAEFGLGYSFRNLVTSSSSEQNARFELAKRRCALAATKGIAVRQECDNAIPNDDFIEQYVDAEPIHRGTTKLGASAAIGYDSFDYRDATTLAKSSVDKVSFSGSAYLSYLFPSGTTSATAQVKYQIGYEPADERILCPASTGGTVVECFNTPDAPPAKDKSVLVSFDLRHYLGDGLGFPIAIGPLFTYDISDDVFGVDVPLYLVSDGELGLTGGIRFGWRSDTDDAVIGFFIGKAFGHTTSD